MKPLTINSAFPSSETKHVIPKPIIKIKIPLPALKFAPQNNMYTVFTSSYKHGEVDMIIINSDEEIRHFCIELLIGYDILSLPIIDANGKHKGEIFTEDLMEYSIKDMPISLESIIRETINVGNKQVKLQSGTGIRYVVKGHNLISI